MARATHACAPRTRDEIAISTKRNLRAHSATAPPRYGPDRSQVHVGSGTLSSMGVSSLRDTHGSSAADRVACPDQDLERILDAYAEIAGAVETGATVSATLHLIARAACKLVDCSRCGVYLRHTAEPELFRGQAMESPHDNDDDIRRLTVGTAADAFTHEILSTKRPVLIRVAQDDPRTVRAVMRHFRVRSILGVPMVVRDEVIGLFYLDNQQEAHPFPAEQQAIASTFATLAGLAVIHAQHAAAQRTSIEVAQRQNDLLRQSAAIEERLDRLVLNGGTIADIAAFAATLTGKPCSIHDASFRRVAVGQPDKASTRPLPTVLDDVHRNSCGVTEKLSTLKQDRPVVVDPQPATGLLHRSLIMPIELAESCWGYLVLMEFGSRFTALDSVVVRHAATAVAFDLVVERRSSQADRHERQTMMRDLVNGLEDEASLVRRAELLGFCVTHPHAITLLAAVDESDPSPSVSDVERAWSALGLPEPVWATRLPGGGIAVAIAPDETATDGPPFTSTRDIASRLRSEIGGDVLCAVSSTCTRPADYRYGRDEAVRILRCLRTLRSSDEDAISILAADDLGACRLMLDMVDRAEADRFIRNTLGPLLDSGNTTVEELLVTVRVFSEQSRSVRNTARFLGVHENTIRYRLGRVATLTGLDVGANSDAQLTVQIALLILKIQGRLPPVRDPKSDA